MPARVRIRDLSPDQLPKSETAKFAEGWIQKRLSEGEIKEVADRMAGNQAAPIEVEVEEAAPTSRPSDDDLPF